MRFLHDADHYALSRFLTCHIVWWSLALLSDKTKVAAVALPLVTCPWLFKPRCYFERKVYKKIMHLHLLGGPTSEGSLSSLIHESYRLTELREVDAFELRFQPISTLPNIFSHLYRQSS